MTNILFIVPFIEMKQLIESVLEKYDQRKQIKVSFLLETADTLELSKVNNYDVIIARGYTAK